MDFYGNWVEEKKSAYLYRLIAKKEAGTKSENLFNLLAQEAERQAAIWAEKIKKQTEQLPSSYHPDLRTRLVAILVKVFGPRHLRMILSAMKVRGMSIYSTNLPDHPIPSSVEELGRRHRGKGAGGNLRAAVFGVNDGLVSNASLILGVAGASTEPKLIILSGIAGLLAGAFSMAAGEFISVRSQKEMYEYQIDLEDQELKEYPEAEAEELALIYEAKGLPADESHRLASQLIGNHEKALDTLAREELGLNPDQLGSPWGAAIFSFISFAFGASVPLVPFLLMSESNQLISSIGLTAAALFLIGAVLSLFTGKNAFLGGLRMLLIGGAAGAATFLIGKILGVSLS